MRCHEIDELLSAYVDGELDDSEREIVFAHLKTCADCSRNLNRITGLKKALKMPGEFDVSPQLADKLDMVAARFAEQHSAGKKQIIYGPKRRQMFGIASALVAASLVVIVLHSSRGTVKEVKPAVSEKESQISGKRPNGAGSNSGYKLLRKGSATRNIDNIFLGILRGEVKGRPEDYGYTTIATVENVDDARKKLGYNFPITKSDELEALYVEDGNILYARHEDDVVIVYHQAPPGYKAANNGIYASNPSIVSTEVRGLPAWMVVDNPNNSNKAISLGWHENGLLISIYCDKLTSVDELKRIAESMR